jgi:hypothetical protein
VARTPSRAVGNHPKRGPSAPSNSCLARCQYRPDQKEVLSGQGIRLAPPTSEGDAPVRRVASSGDVDGPQFIVLSLLGAALLSWYVIRSWRAAGWSRTTQGIVVGVGICLAYVLLALLVPSGSR